MISEEDIWKMEQEKTLLKVKPDLEKALKGLETAIHYLHETGDYESEVLDEICDSTYSNIQLLEGLINA
jgi:hypothetical protein